MPQRNIERATLPTVNREAAEILEQFLNRRLEIVKKRDHSSIREEPVVKRCSKLVVGDTKVTASCDAVDERAADCISLDRHGGVSDTRPHSLPADFKNKINSDVDVKVLLNSIRKDANVGVKGRKNEKYKCTDCERFAGESGSDSSDNYPDEDWLRQKPRKKKNFFKRTKERLQHAFKSQQNNQSKKEQLLYTDIGVLSYHDDECRKRGKRKKGKRVKHLDSRDADGYSSATRSESTTPGKTDILVDPHACNLKRVQSDEVFKHRRVDLKKTLPVLSHKEPPMSMVGQLRDKILNPIRRSFRRSKSKGSESGTNDSTEKSSIHHRPKPDIPRPALPGDEHYHSSKFSDNDSKAAIKVFKEILSLDLHDGVSPRVESPPYVSFNYGKPEPIYADIENAHSQTSFEDIDDGEDVWVLRPPDKLGGGCRDDLFLPGLYEGKVEDTSTNKTEFCYNTLTYEERKRNASVYNRGIEEKAGVYGIIAQKLATIADTCVAKIDSESTGLSDSDSSKNLDKTATLAVPGHKKEAPPVERLNSIERQIIACLRQSGDKIAESHDFPTSAATQLLQHVGYSTFKKTMQNTIGSEPGWDQVAMLFYVTNSAVRLAGASGALASKVKENTLRYFEDKFAEWIVGQGGWDSMLEDTSTPDTELD